MDWMSSTKSKRLRSLVIVVSYIETGDSALEDGGGVKGTWLGSPGSCLYLIGLNVALRIKEPSDVGEAALELMESSIVPRRASWPLRAVSSRSRALEMSTRILSPLILAGLQCERHRSNLRKRKRGRKRQDETHDSPNDNNSYIG